MANDLVRAIDPIYLSGVPRAKARPTERVGVSGVNIVGGYLNYPDKDSKLQGRERFLTFSDILANVSIVATGVRYFNELVGKAHWSVEPADVNDHAAVEVAEFVDSCLSDLDTPFERVVRRAAMYRFYGFSIQEWIMKPREDGRLGYLDVEPRPQVTIEKWDCDEIGVVNGVWQRTPVSGQMLYLPRTKLVYLTDDSINSSPDGLGLLRHTVKPAMLLSRYEDLELWGFETDLRGIPVARAPLAELEQAVADGDMTAVQAQQQRAPLESFVVNHIRGPRTGLLLDSMTYQTTDEHSTPSQIKKWDLELMKAEGVSYAEIGKAIVRKQFEIARLLGVEHLMLGGDGSGSLALSQSGLQRLSLMVNGSLNEIASSFNVDFVRPLMILNKIPKELWPKLKPDDISYRTIQELTSSLLAMAQAGSPLMPDDPAIGEVRDILGLSRPNSIEDLKAMLGDAQVVIPDDAPQGTGQVQVKPTDGQSRQHQLTSSISQMGD